MSSRLNPYINLEGSARQALEFYESVFGGTLSVNTYGQYGAPAGTEDYVMHGQLDTERGFTLMASDVVPEMGMDVRPGSTVSISLSGDDVEELRGYWAKLSDGGTITVPLEKQMWGDEFGQVTDRFGIAWLVDIYEAEG